MLFLIVRESVYKILWNFEIQTDQPIPARRTELVLINKNKTYPVDFAIPADHRVKIKSEQVPGPC